MLWNRLAPFLSKRYISSFQTSPLSSSTLGPPIQPWLFIGLGNPGEKYQSTRHNVGFDMIDAFAQSQGITLTTHYFKALFGEGMVDGAGPLAAYYKLPLNRVLVVYDDMDLPCGVLRLQPKGGYGRHNGLKSVINNFRRNREFCRLRIGIGRPPGQMDPKAFVLQKFNRTGHERAKINVRIDSLVTGFELSLDLS
ncbi:hypothetical protein EJB05_06631 [Eragrostis curvula]|uniref:Peptidyl-tRNA hydrolase n=1 Tax=Eragrostis curvula TaxID=38414 RepID=A0A5J9WG77_9POAL|nr:hypothetical protein EJB05_06631 [Eragrostis curvula]